jgi:hypothetical protein
MAAVERRVSTNLLEVLNMADQARLEGRRGSMNSAAAVEAATILIRIAYRFQSIARARLGGSELALPQSVRERCAILEEEYCFALESDLRMLESTGFSEDSPPAAAGQRATELADVNERAIGTPEDIGLSANVANLAPQIEPYRRLPILLGRLGAALSKIEAY